MPIFCNCNLVLKPMATESTNTTPSQSPFSLPHSSFMSSHPFLSLPISHHSSIKLNSKNYMSWKTQFLQLLNCYGLAGFINEAEVLNLHLPNWFLIQQIISKHPIQLTPHGIIKTSYYLHGYFLPLPRKYFLISLASRAPMMSGMASLMHLVRCLIPPIAGSHWTAGTQERW